MSALPLAVDGLSVRSTERVATIEAIQKTPSTLLPTLALTKTPSFGPTASPIATRATTQDAVLLDNFGEDQPDAIVWSPDSMVIYIGGENGLSAYDTNTFSKLFSVLEGSRVRSVTLDSDGKILTCGIGENEWQGQDTIAFLDARTGDMIGKIYAEYLSLANIISSSSGKTLVVTFGGDYLSVYDISAAKSLEYLFTAYGYQDGGFTFSPNAETFAMYNIDNKVVLLDSRGNPIKTLQDDCVYDLAFSPNNQELAAGSCDGSIKIWNVPEGKLLIKLNVASHDDYSNTKAVRAIIFHPNGKMIASVSAGETIILWDITMGAPVHEFYMGTNWKDKSSYFIPALKFSPDGTKLASGDANGNIWLWKVPY